MRRWIGTAEMEDEATTMMAFLDLNSCCNPVGHEAPEIREDLP